MKRDGFSVYTSLPRAALTSDFIIFFFLEKAALHNARFKVSKRSTQKSELCVAYGWCGSVIN